MLGTAPAALADACKSVTGTHGTTATLCVTGLRPQGGTLVVPANGTDRNSTPIAISGGTLVTATVTWTQKPPVGETRGCYGERRTPSGCLSWMDATTSSTSPKYILTELFPSNSQLTRNYSWTWATSQYPNGNKVLQATIKLDGSDVRVEIPVSITNGSLLKSPVPNGGKVPSGSGVTVPFTIAATGDGPSGSPQSGWVSGMIHRWNPSFLMYLGDVYQRGMKDEFLNFYDPLYGASDPSAYWNRTLPTIGNHEYKWNPNGEDYFWYWNYPQNSPTSPGGGGGWYSLNVAGWHIISLNSNVGMTYSATDPSLNTPQGQWLHDDLAQDKINRPQSGKPCTLAFFHHPRYSDISLRKPSTSAFWNQMFPYKADIFVNAHSHVYERWDNLNNSGGKGTVSSTGIPSGITEFVVGTGGNVLAQVWQTNNVNSNFRQNTQWGALKLTLYPDHAHYEFWAATSASASGDQLKDSGDIKCH